MTGRIGIDLTLLDPGRMGGVESYVRSLLRCLADIDQRQPYVLYGAPKALDSVDPNRANFARQHIIPKNKIGNFAFRSVRRLLTDAIGFDLAANIVGRQQLSVLHEPFGFVRMSTSIPIVLTVLDIQHEFYPHFFPDGAFEQRRESYLKSMNSATHIIAISDFTKATIVDRYGIEPAKVTTVHIGLDSRFQQVTDLHALGSTRAKYNLPSAFAYYPANSWPHKNHATLLQTIRLLKDQGQLDFKLVLTGVVYPEHQGLFALLEELGLRDDVMHLGFLPHADIPAIYALASCLVFPSLFEGFGMPVLEAMSCGCPVICSNSTSLPELCGDAGMLVDPMREEEIAQALATLMVDNTVRLDLVERGLARAQLFTGESMARKTLAVYKSLGAPAT